MSLKNTSVLVTGGAGFIGSHLVDRLVSEDPENLVVVDNLFLGKDDNVQSARKAYPHLKIFHMDAADPAAMKNLVESEGTDVVFNLAVIPLPASLERPVWSFDQNCKITSTLCELARSGHYKTLIHFSSSEAYGTSISGPMDENHPLNATTPYAASKAASDLLVLSYVRTFGIESAIIRPFNNYGPRQNEKSYAGVIPLTIKRLYEHQPPVIYGTGNQTRDYLYVTDTADAAVRIYHSQNTRGRVLNIASGKEVSIRYLVEKILHYWGSDLRIVYEPERPGDVQRHIANTYLAKDLIGFTPTVEFDEGLKKTVEWYKTKVFPSAGR
ncbi:MAG TPA: GDP-mannose 4,6-dehydratase [Methanoregulaceae archaeon]|nr:GDP-mannose 4,6-dehydratase [Methanoregulaceae archaeon]